MGSMKRSTALNDEQLTEAFRRAAIGEQFYVMGNKSEQNRAYSCAGCVGRQIAMRKFRQGWKATVIK